MRPILLKLAHRLITSSPTPSYIHPERFHLHLSILLNLELWDEADKLIDSDVGKNICAMSLSCNEVRRAIWSKQGRLRQEGERAEKVIVDKKQVLTFSPESHTNLNDRDRNWLEFLAVLDAALPSTLTSSIDTDVQIQRAKELFRKVAEEDGLKDRSGLLGLLELERRARLHNVNQGVKSVYEFVHFLI
jgi:N-terminal acetyltransferase B complex non-catalytic subunit